MVVILNNSSFQFSQVRAQLQECWHKKLEHLCMAALNSYEKKNYDFGNDFCFQNEEFSP